MAAAHTHTHTHITHTHIHTKSRLHQATNIYKTVLVCWDIRGSIINLTENEISVNTLSVFFNVCVCVCVCVCVW